MHLPSDGTITELLHAAGRGDDTAIDRLFERVYQELKGLARLVRGGRAGETLDTTALVHEAYLKLLPSADMTWEGRAHFFAVAGRAMRQILVDAARRRAAAKRGGGAVAVTFDDDAHSPPIDPVELMALDDALERLAAFDPRRAQVVEHRVFAGLSTRETAVVLGVSTGTVERDWRAARAWLALELGGDPGVGDPGGGEPGGGGSV